MNVWRQFNLATYIIGFGMALLSLRSFQLWWVLLGIGIAGNAIARQAFWDSMTDSRSAHTRRGG